MNKTKNIRVFFNKVEPSVKIFWGILMLLLVLSILNEVFLTLFSLTAIMQLMFIFFRFGDERYQKIRGENNQAVKLISVQAIQLMFYTHIILLIILMVKSNIATLLLNITLVIYYFIKLNFWGKNEAH